MQIVIQFAGIDWAGENAIEMNLVMDETVITKIHKLIIICCLTTTTTPTLCEYVVRVWMRLAHNERE